MNYVKQIFGNREVIRNRCEVSDWSRIGLRIPSRSDKYVLTKCLNCGAVIPCEIRNLRRQPPKRCVLCSNIGNHSSIRTSTNTWVKYDDTAVCNVQYGKMVISFYIDADDYNTISQYVWRITKKRQKYYVVTGSHKKGTACYLHKMVLGTAEDGCEIDHIDGNSLNNRKANLRIASRQENIDNQRATRIDNLIGIRGISYNKSSKKYHVDFYYHGMRFYTKDWSSVEEAVWCRYCFEDHFGLPAIKSNPLAEQYYTLADDKKEEIQQYVLEQILGNERYKKFTLPSAVTRESGSVSSTNAAG